MSSFIEDAKNLLEEQYAGYQGVGGKDSFRDYCAERTVVLMALMLAEQEAHRQGQEFAMRVMRENENLNNKVAELETRAANAEQRVEYLEQNIIQAARFWVVKNYGELERMRAFLISLVSTN